MTRKEYEKHQHEANKRVKRLRRLTGSAIADYRMIEDGDHVMVALSGGKDSYTLLELLIRLREAAPVDFRITAVNLDQGQPGYDREVLPAYLKSRAVDYEVVKQDNYSVVQRVIPEGKPGCSLCSRLRRGALYSAAARIGADKIALGHHRDDIIETLFLNLFFGGTLKTMPPKLKSDDGRHILIRPLAYVKEEDISAFAAQMEFPVISCGFCVKYENKQRGIIKQMMRDWERKHPGRVENIFRAMSNVAPSHLLDRELFDFESL